MQTFQNIDPLTMTSVIYYADHNRDFRMKKKSFLYMYMYVYRQHVFESMLYECVKRRIKYSSCQVKHFFFLFSSSAKKRGLKKEEIFLYIFFSFHITIVAITLHWIKKLVFKATPHGLLPLAITVICYYKSHPDSSHVSSIQNGKQ